MFFCFQKVSSQVPYQDSRQVCTQNQLWSYAQTVPVYPWAKLEIVVRGGLEGPCDNLDANEITEENLEKCEVVCQQSNITECAKVMIRTDEEGKEIWEDDPDNCVELEKTECRVQEREAAGGERAADTVHESEEDIPIAFEDDMATSTASKTDEDANSEIIFFPDN